MPDDRSLHNDRPVLLVQCANQHKRITRDINSLCTECGGAPINAYSLEIEPRPSVGLLYPDGADDE